MKSIVFYFNCHGNQIMHHLLNSNDIRSRYHILIISINDYMINGKYNNEDNFVDYHKKILENADILICQYIKTDRGFLNHQNVISFTKKECQIITLPHYTFSGYFYYDHIIAKLNELDASNLNLYHNNLKNIIDFEEINMDDFQKYLTNEFFKLEEIDKLSDIKMYDIVKNNYQKERLWLSHCYPSSKFFYYIAQNILRNINLDDNITYIENFDFHKKNMPILPQIKQVLKLEFDTDIITYYDIKCSIYEFYCIRKNLNIPFNDDPKLFWYTDSQTFLNVVNEIKNQLLINN